jgi:hypothetical protein
MLQNYGNHNKVYITHHCPAMTPLELQNIHTDYIHDMS